MFIFLGNHNPIDGRTGEPLDQNVSTCITVPDEFDLENLEEVVSQIWEASATSGSVPAWVASTDPDASAMISELYDGIPIREPIVPPEVI